MPKSGGHTLPFRRPLCGAIGQYLTYLYTNEHGEAPPEVVGPLQLTEVFINVGRWIWQCAKSAAGLSL